MFWKRKRPNGAVRTEKVYVLSGHWEMPCEDHGSNVWAVGNDEIRLMDLMFQVGEDMTLKAREEYGCGFVTEFGKTYYEADDLDGNFVSLCITEHKLNDYEYDNRK